MDPALRNLMDGAGNDEVEAVLRLEPGGTVPPGVRLVARFGDIATCRLRRSRIAEAWADEDVASLKAPRRFGIDPDPLPAAAESTEGAVEENAGDSDVRRPEGLPETGRGVLVGVVDWGFDFAHPDFRQAGGSTRAVALWDQAAPGPGPAPYGYGRIYTREEIDRALATDKPYETLGYHPASGDPGGSGAHGTHVLGIAAGNGRAGSPAGIAPEAELVFVHLASRGTGRSASLGDSVTLLEALDWIARLAGSRPWVVNLSMGVHGGDHLGKTLVEQAIDALLMEAPGREVCQSAGNYHGARVHAEGCLRPGQERKLRWWTDPADVTPNELEVWYPGIDTFAVEVRAPEAGPAVRVPLGGQASIIAGGREVGRAYHRGKDPNSGDNHVDVFLYREAPAGCWEVTLTADDVVDGRFHAWVERDAGCPGCQSRFDPEDAVETTTTGTICNGFLSFAVGAYDQRSPGREPAPFSSCGPTRDGRIKPDLLAPGVRILAARSASLELGETTPLLTRMSGTSMAAPHVTGTVALLFEAAGRPLHVQETRRLLLSTTDPVPHDLTQRAGSGYLDIERAVAAARALAATPRRKTTPPAENDVDNTPQEDSMDIPHSPCSCGSAREGAVASVLQPETDHGDCPCRRKRAAPAWSEPPRAAEWNPAEELLELADQVATAGLGASLLDRILARTESAASAGNWPGSSLSPAALFDAVLADGARRRKVEADFEVLALPGERPREPLREGDLVVRRARGEGGLGHVFMVAGESWAAGELRAAGLTGESLRAGSFVPVVEGGFRPHGRADGFARLAVDSAGRLPFDQILLRPRLTPPVNLEQTESEAGHAFTPSSVIDSRIDPCAQFSLLRLQKAGVAAATDAVGLLTAVKSGALAGIYGENLPAAITLAGKLGTEWWKLLPTGLDAAVVVDPEVPGLAPPTIVFRSTQTRTTEPTKPQPCLEKSRLDAALRKAWASFQLLQNGEAVRCDLLPGPAPIEAEAFAPMVLANVVPAFCGHLHPNAAKAVGRDELFSWCHPYSLSPLLGQIYFPTNSTNLGPDDTAALAKLAQAFNEWGDKFMFDPFKILFQGHADFRPTTFPGGNKALSDDRTGVCRDFFMTQLTAEARQSVLVKDAGRGEDPVPASAFQALGLGREKILKAMRMTAIILVPPQPPLGRPRAPIPPKSREDALARCRQVLRGFAGQFSSEELRHLNHICKDGTVRDSFLNGMDPELLKIAFGLGGTMTDADAEAFANRFRVRTELMRPFSTGPNADDLDVVGALKGLHSRIDQGVDTLVLSEAHSEVTGIVNQRRAKLRHFVVRESKNPQSIYFEWFPSAP